MLQQFEQIPDKEKARKLSALYEIKEAKKLAQKLLREKLDLNYRYIEMWSKAGVASISFGWKASGNMITYAVALQSNKDNFSRKKARIIINERFAKDEVQMFTFWSENTIKDMGGILASHYNSLREIQGVKNVPKYLRRIDIELGW
jgi:hypothetical protein